ncbi:UDP-N-acetylmuramoyl-L-alanyl-D-glutamate--2,6-diaminopimelate ligase [bacterium]|nr:UDP-N-acetylmuramoyl-L-alanyl-D-glutamate--2,6-diaminopimelate ligase [bacterium]
MKTVRDLLPPSEILSSKIPEDAIVSAVSDSTHAVVPGALYFALKGSRSDGHAFIPQALEGGALAVVVESAEAFAACPRAILVKSTRAALGYAASAWHGSPTRALKLVGVTGTNGKTTVSYLLRSIWKAENLRCGLLGTVEYQFGDTIVPASLTTPGALLLQSLFAQMVEAQVTHAAMEVSSIALDQHRVAGCYYDVAVFTNLTPDHLDYHGDMGGYLAAKKRLFNEMGPRVAVLNADDPASVVLKEATTAAQTLLFSIRDASADFGVVSQTISARGIQAVLKTPVGNIDFHSPLLGWHNLSNCLAALAAAYATGVEIQAAARALAESLGAPGRLERVPTSTESPYVFVDYAHSEDALRNVLESLRRVRGDAGGRIFTVFGCGGDRDRTKRPRMARAVSDLSDEVILTSDNPRTEDPQAILNEMESGLPQGRKFFREVDRLKAIELALAQAKAGDFVLVAGKGHETYQILGTQKVPFDDREVVRNYYGRD